MTPTGAIIVAATCRGDRPDVSLVADVEAKLGVSFSDGDGAGALSCKGRPAGPRYRLTVRIQSLSDSAAKTLGFDGGAAFSWQATRPLPARGAARVSGEAGLWTALQNSAMTSDGDALGTPVLRLTSGVEAEVTTGGEFPVTVVGGRATGDEPVFQKEWKSFGLSLKATASPGARDLVRLSFDLNLKTRAGGAGALAVTSLKSTIEIPAGEPTMAGIIDLKTKDSEAQESPFLAAVPLIGPLFRRTTGDEASARAVVWVTLALDDDADLSEADQGSRPGSRPDEATSGGAKPL